MALVIMAVFVGILLAASASMAFMSYGMMGGGMMDGGTGGFNLAWIVSVIALGVVFVVILLVLLAPHQGQQMTPPSTVVNAPAPGAPIPQSDLQVAVADTAHIARMQEATIIRLLDEDERRLYTLVRENGGEMLQRDIVASGSFSKAKVTRLLDKLESKDIIVRERHGMTNNVRLITMPPKAIGPA